MDLKKWVWIRGRCWQECLPLQCSLCWGIWSSATTLILFRYYCFAFTVLILTLNCARGGIPEPVLERIRARLGELVLKLLFDLILVYLIWICGLVHENIQLCETWFDLHRLWFNFGFASLARFLLQRTILISLNCLLFYVD